MFVFLFLYLFLFMRITLLITLYCAIPILLYHTILYCRLNLKDLGLDRVLGGGAFGQVWRGTWRGTPVAVKVTTHSLQSSLSC